jgi:hypothetical protein
MKISYLLGGKLRQGFKTNFMWDLPLLPRPTALASQIAGITHVCHIWLRWVLGWVSKSRKIMSIVLTG